MSSTLRFPEVLVTGGAGYVGSALVPRLLARGHRVRVVDLFWYGHDVLAAHPALETIELDIRDSAALRRAMEGVDAVVHLACISNDPSFELDPALGRSINYDAFAGLREGAVDAGVRRFVYASSSSIYGVQEVPDVCEETPPAPLTDYSRFKLDCERDLLSQPAAGMERVILRPATVCGYAPRLRLDLTVNLLTIHALVNKRIRVFGGSQLRPNIHIEDMVKAYEALLDAPGEAVDGQAFNAGYQNRSVEDIAEMVRERLQDPEVTVVREPSDDLRSYHINSDRIRERLGFEPTRTIEDAIGDVAAAYRRGDLEDPMTNPRYSNIRMMQHLALSPAG